MRKLSFVDRAHSDYYDGMIDLLNVNAVINVNADYLKVKVVRT